MATRNRMGEIGFGLALVAFATLFLIGVTPVVAPLPFLAIPATIFSLIALASVPRRWAWWGLGIGLLSCLYLPTLIIFWMRASSRC